MCTKLSPTSIFSAEFFVPPNTINFATVFAKINIADNPAVFSTVVTFVGVYLLMLLWARRADAGDTKKVWNSMQSQFKSVLKSEILPRSPFVNTEIFSS